MSTSTPSRAEAAQPVFTTVADGLRAQVITRGLLPPHLSSSAHEGRQASCPCSPLLEQVTTYDQWVVAPSGTRQACTTEDHELRPLRVAVWTRAPLALRAQAYRGRVTLTLAMCAHCGAVEVRDTSFHVPAGMRLGSLAPRRRSDVLGWYSGARPAGRVYT